MAGSEVVAREAPGNAGVGIAVLRGSDRVELLGERDGWSEILLSDGRRAWVPAGDLRHDEPSRAPRPTTSPLAGPTSVPARVATAPEPAPQDLPAEIARLRGLVDELTTWRASLPEPAANIPLEVPWLIAGGALMIGVLVGGAWERLRSRRNRSLKF